MTHASPPAAPRLSADALLRLEREQVTDAQLNRYADLVYRRTGIRLSPQKKMLLTNRLRRRLRETGIDCFDKYFDLLTRLQADNPEWDAFLQEITTHETYLFRDEPHWNWFRQVFLPQIAAAGQRRERPKTLRIWSAACSTGDEATTIACCIAACLPSADTWKVRIVGTDIGIDAVAEAKRATFSERAMKLVPDDYRKRFFTELTTERRWKAKPQLTDMQSFRRHNLLDAPGEEPFDLIFLKNVLIYFDGPSKQSVMKHIRAALKPNGMLVAGAAEGVGEFVKGLERLDTWLFRNPPTV